MSDLFIQGGRARQVWPKCMCGCRQNVRFMGEYFADHYKKGPESMWKLKTKFVVISVLLIVALCVHYTIDTVKALRR